MAATTVALRAAVRTRFGGLPGAYWRIWVGSLVNRVGTFVEPFLVLYLTTARGLSVATAGLIAALYGAGAVLAQPLGGWLADRIGRRATMAGAMAAAGVSLVALGAARAPALIAGTAFLTGIFGDAFRPAAQAAVADIVPIADRRRAGGLLFWAANLGFAVAAVTGGFLAEAGYWLLFALDALTCATFGTIIWLGTAETRPAAAARPGGPGFAAVLRDRLMVGYALATLAHGLVLFQVFSVMPLSMRGDGLSTVTFGLVVALNGVLIVVAHPLLAPALLRRPPAWVLAAGTATVAAGSAVGALADSAAGWTATIVVLTVGEILVAAVGPGVVSEIAPSALRGRYQGVYGLAFGLAVMITPLVGTQLLGPGGDSPAPWLCGAALGLLSAAGFAALGPALRRRRAAAFAAD